MEQPVQDVTARGKPTRLAIEVADLLTRLKKKADEYKQTNDIESRFLEKEEEQEQRQEQELEVKKVHVRSKQVELQIKKKQTLKKDKKKEKQSHLLDKAKKGNVKQALKQQQRDRKRSMKQALKKEGRDKALKASGRRQTTSFRNRMQKLVRNMSAYGFFAKRNPGDQAGSIDNTRDQKGDDGKRRVKHDFNFGARSIIEYFTTKIGNVTVRGTVSRKEHATQDGSSVVQQENVSIEQAVTDRGRSLGEEETLGRLSPDAILQSIDRGGQGMSR